MTCDVMGSIYKHTTTHMTCGHTPTHTAWEWKRRAQSRVTHCCSTMCVRYANRVCTYTTTTHTSQPTHCTRTTHRHTMCVQNVHTYPSPPPPPHTHMPLHYCIGNTKQERKFWLPWWYDHDHGDWTIQYQRALPHSLTLCGQTGSNLTVLKEGYKCSCL